MGAEVPEYDGARGLATVIGQNARRMRGEAGFTLDQVSIAARARGLSWSESRVADFEAGRVAPSLPTLIAVCTALADIGVVDATLPELLRSVPPVAVNESLSLEYEQIVSLLRGRPPSHDEVTQAIQAYFDAGVIDAIQSQLPKAPGATEERTIKALGISSNELADWSAALWERTFSEERDQRAGEGANAQKRGQVTRQMRAELYAAIEAAKHGDDQ
jgi:transcriptional regulator with XRE-family HTH domain